MLSDEGERITPVVLLFISTNLYIVFEDTTHLNEEVTPCPHKGINKSEVTFFLYSDVL